jgi:hypothetical protein
MRTSDPCANACFGDEKCKMDPNDCCGKGTCIFISDVDLKKKLTFGYHKTMSYIHGSLGVEVQVTMNIFVSKNYTYDSKV